MDKAVYVAFGEYLCRTNAGLMQLTMREKAHELELFDCGAFWVNRTQ